MRKLDRKKRGEEERKKKKEEKRKIENEIMKEESIRIRCQGRSI